MDMLKGRLKRPGMGEKTRANYQNNSSRKSKCKPVFDLFYQLINFFRSV